MATELQKQVQNLQKQVLTASSLRDGRASLFMSSSEAAAVDTRTVWEAAVEGLSTLGQYDGRLLPYLDTLLHSTSIDIQRELKTREENDVLDKEIQRLLVLLSIWSSEQQCHVVLEYLIRRYRIHELNMDALLRCVIVAHEHKIFPKVVALCKVDGTIWAFLAGVKDSGVTLPRNLIVQRIQKNASLLEMITEVTLTALQLGGVRKGGVVTDGNAQTVRLTQQLSPQAHVGIVRIVSFFMAIVTELAETTVFDDIRMRHIYVWLLEGLKVRFNPLFSAQQTQLVMDWKSTSCLLIAQLSRKTRFGVPLSRAFSNGLAHALAALKARESNDDIGRNLCNTIMTTIVILAQHGQLEITANLLSSLFKEVLFVSTVVADIEQQSQQSVGLWFISMVKELSNTGLDTGSLVLQVASTTFERLVADVEAEEQDVDKSGLLNVDVLATQLCQLLRADLLPPVFVRDLIVRVLTQADPEDGAVSDALIVVARAASNWAPRVFDEAVIEANRRFPLQRNEISAVLANIFSGSNDHLFNASGDSLYTSLTSPIADVRLQALRNYAALPQVETTPDAVGLAEAALQCLDDIDGRIAATAWSREILLSITRHLGFEPVRINLSTVWIHWAKVSARMDGDSGLSVLSAVLTSIADADILKSLFSTDNASLESFVTWVVACMEGSFALSASPAQQIALRVAAVRVAVNLSQSVGLFNNLLGAKAIVRDSPQLNYVYSVLSENASTNLPALVKKVIAMDTGNVETDCAYTLAITQFMLSVVLAGGDAVEPLLLDCVAPLVLRLISFRPSVSLLTLVHSYFEMCASKEVGHNAVLESTANIVQFISTPIAFNDVATRIIQALLCSTYPKHWELLDSAMQAFFPASAFGPVLVRLSVCPTDQAGEVGHALALNLLATLVSRVAPTTNGSTEESDLLVCSSVAMLWGASQTHDATRRYAVVLAKELGRMSPRTTLKFAGLAIDGSSLARLSALIVERESSVTLQADAAVVLTSASLARDAKSKAVRELISVLWAFVTSISWSQQSLAAVVVKTILPASIASAWEASLPLLAPEKISEGPLLTAFLAVCDRALRETTDEASSVAAAEHVSQTVKEMAGYEHVVDAPVFVDSHKLLRDGLLRNISRAPLSDLSKASSAQLYDALMTAQLSRSGDALVLGSFASLVVDPAVPLRLLESEVAAMTTISSTSGATEAVSEMDDQTSISGSAGVAVPLQRLMAVTEVAVPAILKNSQTKDNQVRILLTALMNALSIACGELSRTVLAIEFYKSALVDYVQQSLVYLSSKGTLAVPSKKAAGDREYYLERVAGDISLLVQCVATLRSAQVQLTVFASLRVLLGVCPEAIESTMTELGGLLASAATATIVSREKFLAGMLDLLLSLALSEGVNSPSAVQAIFQSLCTQLPSMGGAQRLSLLRTALKVLKYCPEACVSAIHVLLVHTVAVYEGDAAEHHRVLEGVAEGDSSIDSICLSRASQRRANRAAQSTGAEEYFQLAQQLALELAPDAQLRLLADLLRGGQDLARVVAAPVVVAGLLEFGIVNVSSSLSFLNTLLVSAGAMSPSSDSEISSLARGQAATLVMLHLEFVLDLLENRTLHMIQAKAANPDLQAQCLAIADVLLALAALGDGARRELLRSAQVQKTGAHTLTLRLENRTYAVNAAVVMELMSGATLESLGALQRLLDGPSFVAIVQELLSHELLSIRQRAVLVLRTRLEAMAADGIATTELPLYLTLSARMRGIVTSFISECFLGVDSESSTANRRRSQGALVQSAIMCLDVLIQYLGTTAGAEWRAEVSATMREFQAVLLPIYEVARNGDVLAMSNRVVEAKKLLGSMLLCCASVCKALGPAALPFFPKLSEAIFVSLTGELASWVQWKQQAESTVTASDVRTHILFSRSVVSTLTLVVAALPQFVHSQLTRLLPLVLSAFASFGTEGLSEMRGLCEDAHACLSIVAAKVAPRLLVPVITSTITSTLTLGHVAAARVAQFVLAVLKASDRPTTLSHLAKWSGVALDLLSYRERHGDASLASAAVEACASEAVVEMCLKLTEKELKALVLRVVDWADRGKKVSDEVYIIRCGALHSLLNALLDKLQFLFYPTIGGLWESVVENLNRGRETVDKLTQESSGRKRVRVESTLVSLSDDSQRRVVEAVYLSEQVLGTIHRLCDTSQHEFIDERRFDDVYVKVVSLLSLRHAFVGDEEYLSFAENHVTASLVSLCLGVNRDLLWKPLNYKVLLLTRHESPVVRRAAVRAIRLLFTGVGEDYLLLLPESLSFISELLEDDHHDVVAETRVTIRAIEDLSGEQLDSYLQ